MTRNGPDDEFELRLRRRERLVPRFDTDLDGPDEAVDRAVLARARATVMQPPVAEPHYQRVPRWTLPIALAATVLLSFTLVMQMDSREVVVQRTADGASDATRAADADVPAGVAEASLQPEREALGDVTMEAATLQTAPVPVPVPAPPPAPADVPAQRVTAAAAGASTESITAPASRREATVDRAASAAATEPPEAWLERIEALRAAGDLAAAQRELAAFRRQHPDAELPPSLRSLRDP